MYAIVEINGQQFKAEAGKKLFVNHIKDVEAGKTVEFDRVLLVDNDGAVTVGAPTVEGAKVVAEVVNPLVKGDKVVVWADDVPRPVAVRYGWADNPTCTLRTASGLHVAPFRTDSWPRR